MIERFYVFRNSDGTPHRMMYSDTIGRGFIIDEGCPIAPADLGTDYRYLGESRENVHPETLAAMLAITYRNTETAHAIGDKSADFISECDLHVIPRLIELDVEIKKDKTSELPWKLVIKERKKGTIFLEVPDFEEWHYAKVYASWYLTALSNMQVNLDFNYRIEKS